MNKKKQENPTIEEVLDLLDGICIYWECEGPDVEPTDMKTCVVCRAIQMLKKVKEDQDNLKESAKGMAYAIVRVLQSDCHPVLIDAMDEEGVDLPQIYEKILCEKGDTFE